MAFYSVKFCLHTLSSTTLRDLWLSEKGALYAVRRSAVAGRDCHDTCILHSFSTCLCKLSIELSSLGTQPAAETQFPTYRDHTQLLRQTDSPAITIAYLHVLSAISWNEYTRRYQSIFENFFFTLDNLGLFADLPKGDSPLSAQGLSPWL